MADLNDKERRLLMRNIQALVDRQDDFIDDTVEGLSREYSKAIDALGLRALRALPTDSDGRIIADTKTIRRILPAERVRLLSSTDVFKDIWTEWDRRLGRIQDNIQDHFETSEGALLDEDAATARAEWTDNELAAIREMRGQWPNANGNGSGLAGRFFSLSDEHRRALADTITRGVLGRQRTPDLVEQLARATETSTKRARFLFDQGTMEYSRAVHDRKAADLGYEHFRYFGPLDKITRPFCHELLVGDGIPSERTPTPAERERRAAERAERTARRNEERRKKAEAEAVEAEKKRKAQEAEAEKQAKEAAAAEKKRKAEERKRKDAEQKAAQEARRAREAEAAAAKAEAERKAAEEERARIEAEKAAEEARKAEAERKAREEAEAAARAEEERQARIAADIEAARAQTDDVPRPVRERWNQSNVKAPPVVPSTPEAIQGFNDAPRLETAARFGKGRDFLAKYDESVALNERIERANKLTLFERPRGQIEQIRKSLAAVLAEGPAAEIEAEMAIAETWADVLGAVAQRGGDVEAFRRALYDNEPDALQKRLTDPDVDGGDFDWRTQWDKRRKNWVELDFARRNSDRNDELFDEVVGELGADAAPFHQAMERTQKEVVAPLRDIARRATTFGEGANVFVNGMPGGHWGSAKKDNATAIGVALATGNTYQPIDNGLKPFAAELKPHEALEAEFRYQYAQRRMAELDESHDTAFRGMAIPADVVESLVAGEVDRMPMTGATALSFQRGVAEHYLASTWTKDIAGEDAKPVLMEVARDDDFDLNVGMYHHQTNNKAGPPFEILQGLPAFQVDAVETRDIDGLSVTVVKGRFTK